MTISDKNSSVVIRRVDYGNAYEATALVELLDGYAQSAAGGGKPLPLAVKKSLPEALRQQPQAFSVMAWAGGANPQAHALNERVPIGLINCFEGFSTFACRPLINVHDVVVVPAWRGLRIAQRMLQTVEIIACERGACKLTMEVLTGNHSAMRSYARAGFEPYTLDPQMGQAQFLQKMLY